MECVVPGRSVKIFAKIIQCLSKVGEELFLEPTADKVQLATCDRKMGGLRLRFLTRCYGVKQPQVGFENPQPSSLGLRGHQFQSQFLRILPSHLRRLPQMQSFTQGTRRREHICCLASLAELVLCVVLCGVRSSAMPCCLPSHIDSPEVYHPSGRYRGTGGDRAPLQLGFVLLYATASGAI